MATRILPDVDLLRQCFSYDPETGVLTHKSRPRSMYQSNGKWKTWHTIYAGKPAGCLSKHHGYLQVQILGTIYLVHRVIWKHYYGTEPSQILDHINRDKLDNRIVNLRPATMSQNQANRPAPRQSLTKIKGVSPSRGGFVAMITVAGKPKNLGRFKTAEEAQAAYAAAASTAFGEYNPIA